MISKWLEIVKIGYTGIITLVIPYDYLKKEMYPIQIIMQENNIVEVFAMKSNILNWIHKHPELKLEESNLQDCSICNF